MVYNWSYSCAENREKSEKSWKDRFHRCAEIELSLRSYIYLENSFSTDNQNGQRNRENLQYKLRDMRRVQLKEHLELAAAPHPLLDFSCVCTFSESSYSDSTKYFKRTDMH